MDPSLQEAAGSWLMPDTLLMDNRHGVFVFALMFLLVFVVYAVLLVSRTRIALNAATKSPSPINSDLMKPEFPQPVLDTESKPPIAEEQAITSYSNDVDRPKIPTLTAMVIDDGENDRKSANDDKETDEQTEKSLPMDIVQPAAAAAKIVRSNSCEAKFRRAAKPKTPAAQIRRGKTDAYQQDSRLPTPPPEDIAYSAAHGGDCLENIKLEIPQIKTPKPQSILTRNLARSEPPSPTSSTSSPSIDGDSKLSINRSVSAPPPSAEYKGRYYSPFETGLHVQLPPLNQPAGQYFHDNPQNPYIIPAISASNCNFSGNCNGIHHIERHQSQQKCYRHNSYGLQQPHQQQTSSHSGNRNLQKPSVTTRNGPIKITNGQPNTRKMGDTVRQQSEFSLFDKRLSAIFGRSPR